MDRLNLKIFKTNRIRLDELFKDAKDYIKTVYNVNNLELTSASPFMQIINVVVNLGRMVLFYVENSITEMNIATAYQARSIRGLSALTGHEPSRGLSARGSLYMSYNMDSEYAGETIYISNYTKVKNTMNGLTYMVILPTNVLQLTVGAYDSKIELPIVQGELKYQQGTGTGEALQSFNFALKDDGYIDDFFVNVYVNGKRWEPVKSILDMTFNQEACMIRTSVNGGIDIFFGTGNNGKIPVVGSTILCEYVTCNGESGNVTLDDQNMSWEFIDDGFDSNSDPVNLNDIYFLSAATDIIFGSNGESLELTRKIAPNASRSFVLANPINYKTLLSKLNMFSIIDVFSGFNTGEDAKADEIYTQTKAEYQTLRERYASQVNYNGVDSHESVALMEEINQKKQELDHAKMRLEETRLDDNVIYLYLVPDISKRLAEGENYFNCAISRFSLTEYEKESIIELIEKSGSKVMTVDNVILDPIFVKFAMNIFVRIYDTYSFSSIKSAIISAVSLYLIANQRRTRIPCSDIIKIVEAIDGVDSVSVYFDADRNNSSYFGDGNYGIDEYGDIIISRSVSDRFGNSMEVNDIQPLFRGGFTSCNGIYYDDNINDLTSPINITLRGVVSKNI